MKKFLALFAATLMLFAVFTGCKSKETSAAAKTSDSPVKSVNSSVSVSDRYKRIDISKASDDDCFVWNDTTITGLTSKGKTQEKLIIPNKAVEIAKEAFMRDDNVLVLGFQNKDTKLDDGIMSYCEHLQAIVLPKNLKIVPQDMAAICVQLVDIVIPETVTEIGKNAFSGCMKLESINIPKSVNKLGPNAFVNDECLKTIVIPNGIQTICERCFDGCKSLESISLPSTVTEIKYAAFKNCTSLSAIVLPQSLTKVYAHAFDNCVRIKNIDIPESVTSIEDKTFSLGEGSIIRVKKGSFADKNFDSIAWGSNIKQYY